MHFRHRRRDFAKPRPPEEQILVNILSFCASLKVCRGGDRDVIRTITIGSCISVQGIFECAAENGRIVVRVGSKTYEGKPVRA